MVAKPIPKDLERFQHCDQRFYPYLGEVLERLPEVVCFGGVLEDLGFEIVSFDLLVANGQFRLAEYRLMLVILIRLHTGRKVI